MIMMHFKIQLPGIDFILTLCLWSLYWAVSFITWQQQTRITNLWIAELITFGNSLQVTGLQIMPLNTVQVTLEAKLIRIL